MKAEDSPYHRYRSTQILPAEGRMSRRGRMALGAHFERCFGRWLKGLPVSAKILDAGCGDGKIVQWLHGKGYSRAIGMDLDRESIEAGLEEGIQGIAIGDAIEFMSKSPGAFQIVFMRNVLEHIPKQKSSGSLQIIRESLVPGGWLVIQVPNAGSPFFGRIRYGDVTHETAFTDRSVRQVLALAGFRSIEICEIPVPLLGILQWMDPRRIFENIRICCWKILKTWLAFAVWCETGRRKAIVTEDLIAAASR